MQCMTHKLLTLLADTVRSENGHVLVHCQAGVSRSSTITIAYVMARTSLGMLSAFRFVKSRRSIIAPNFNFMGQLLEFELLLGGGSYSSELRQNYGPVERCVQSDLACLVANESCGSCTPVV